MYRKKIWWVFIIVSLAIMIPFMAPYLTMNPANSRIAITSVSMEFPALVAHIIFAFIALIAGFLQFSERLRQARPKVHRYIGRVYVGSVLLSGLLALVTIFYVQEFTKAVSFLVLTILWMFTCWKGYRTAVRKRFAEHRIWMIRSFGFTLVAVCSRLLVPVLLLTYAVLNRFSLPGGRERMIEEVLNVNIWVGIVARMTAYSAIVCPESDACLPRATAEPNYRIRLK